MTPPSNTEVAAILIIDKTSHLRREWSEMSKMWHADAEWMTWQLNKLRQWGQNRNWKYGGLQRKIPHWSYLVLVSMFEMLFQCKSVRKSSSDQNRTHRAQLTDSLPYTTSVNNSMLIASRRRVAYCFRSPLFVYFVCFFVAMFITVATLRENGCSYYYETFKIKGQSIYDYAITFAMRQHGSTLQ